MLSANISNSSVSKPNRGLNLFGRIFFNSTSFISPFAEDRDQVRKLFDEEEFVEIFVDCKIETCIKRDPKGLYRKAMNNDLRNFTGISSPYEPPVCPEIKLNNDDGDLNKNVAEIIRYLTNKNIIPEKVLYV